MKLIATGGGSDGNFTSTLGIPTIDGIGPKGGSAHSQIIHDRTLSKSSFLPAVPAGIGLSALIHLFYDIGDQAGNTICIQQLDDIRDLISLFDGQFMETRAFEDADTVFFQQADSRIQVSNPKPQNCVVLHVKRGK